MATLSQNQTPGWGQPDGNPQQDPNQSWGAPPPQGNPPQQPQAQQPPPQQPPPQQPPPQQQQAGWGGQSGGTPPQSPGAVPTKYCQACGSVIDARAEICPNCGVRQAGAPGTGKSRPIAIILALLLGWLGIHRFYLGNIAWGVVYLLFFWTSIPGILAWVEALYFLTRSDEEWAHKYGGPVQNPNSVGMGCLWIWALLPIIVFVASFALIILAGAA